MTTLTLYQTEITLDRNARVENIDVYLNSLTPAYGPVNMQYLRLQGDMIIKLARDQEFSVISDCNYAKIEQDDKSFYFFILGADWRARKTVAFTLSMDTVNTWWDELSWNPKTTIQRQHGDRFYQTEDKLHLYRKIDRYNEGLNPMLTYGMDEYPVESAVLPNEPMNWYLIYKARDNLSPSDTINPVSAMVVADQPLLIEPAVPGGDTQFADKANNIAPAESIAWFSEEMVVTGKTGSIKLYGVDDFVLGSEHKDHPGEYLRAVSFGKNVLGWRFRLLYYTGSNPQSYAYSRTETAEDTGEGWVIIRNMAEYRLTLNDTYYKDLTNYATINSAGSKVDLPGDIELQTIPFSGLDRANSRITKIIKLPYPPCMVLKEPDGRYVFPDGWDFNKTYDAMETILSDQAFRSPLDDISLESQFICELGSAPAPWNEYLNYGMESKLYNSEFYNLSLMYDNVSHQVKLERLEPFSTLSDYIPYVKPAFYVSNSMSSNFLFDIQYMNAMREPEYPYDNYILSTRNNEMTVFSSGFVDYLRNGYNYDQEANRQANRQQIISAGIAVAGAIGSIWTGGASLAAASAGIAALNMTAGGYKQQAINAGAYTTNDKPFAQYNEKKLRQWGAEYFGISQDQVDVGQLQVEQEDAIASYNVAMGKLGQAQSQQSLNSTIATNNMITRGLDSANSVYNSIESISANNRNFQASLTQKQSLAINAQGSGDVDLMSIYAKNRLCVQEYGMREEDKINVARVFYYTGYNHPVQEIPNWDSRYWFNYIQCTPKFNDEQTCVYRGYINDIKARFALGITVYHEHNGEYDFNQTKENWETWLID